MIIKNKHLAESTSIFLNFNNLEKGLIYILKNKVDLSEVFIETKDFVSIEDLKLNHQDSDYYCILSLIDDLKRFKDNKSIEPLRSLDIYGLYDKLKMRTRDYKAICKKNISLETLIKSTKAYHTLAV